ncbi:MAG: phosphotransferase [Lachnospiraceae bacterium]|nr:phosphotransferase [Lachnospiraceae bacterium]
METSEIKIVKPSEADIKSILEKYGIESFLVCKEIDSTRDEEDVRWNYVIDKKYVLRFNSSDVMTEGRLQEINALIGRYIEEGIQCPKYIVSLAGSFIVRWASLYCYLSEYLDYELASERTLRDEDALWAEVKDFTAAFAQKYKNIGISKTMSMYSLFELCPYDQKAGIDEKQENLNGLTEIINQLGYPELSRRLADRNNAVREELKSFYAQLPRCVFQGDENFSNVLIDEDEHFAGLIDFNMSGTDVIVNYLANNAGFDIEEEDLAAEPDDVLEGMIAGYRENMQWLFDKYRAEEAERRAAALYAYIVLISSWPNVACYQYCLKQSALSEKMRGLLERIAGLDIKELYI